MEKLKELKFIGNNNNTTNNLKISSQTTSALTQDFKVLREDEVIKVPNCTYFNDVKYTTTFFFCQCSEIEFFPICKSCSEICHKHHSPTLKLDGIFDCQCGKCNHTITDEDDIRFQEKKLKSNNTCIYTNFYNLTASKGFKERQKKKIIAFIPQSSKIKIEDKEDDIKSFEGEKEENKIKIEYKFSINKIEKKDTGPMIIEEKEAESEAEVGGEGLLGKKVEMNTISKGPYISVCSTCAETCLPIEDDEDCLENQGLSNIKKAKLIKNTIYLKDYSNCQCPKHYEFNQVNGNLDLMGKFDVLQRHLLNFNSNLILKIPFIKEKYTDLIKNSIEKIYSSSKKKSNFNLAKKADELLFKVVYNFKALELYDYFSSNQSKYFYYQDRIFEGIPQEFILKLVAYETTGIKDSEKSDYAHCRMLFASLVFESFIKAPFMANFCKYSISTLLNMNLLQRFFIFQKSQEFHLNNPYKEYFTSYEALKKALDKSKFSLDLSEKMKNEDTKEFFGLGRKDQKFKQFFPSKDFIIDFCSSILDLYDYILKINESYNIKNTVLGSIFPKLNQIFKFLIKYNLISTPISMRYFDLVIDTIVLVQDEEKDNEEDEDDKKGGKCETGVKQPVQKVSNKQLASDENFSSNDYNSKMNSENFNSNENKAEKAKEDKAKQKKTDDNLNTKDKDQGKDKDKENTSINKNDNNNLNQEQPLDSESVDNSGEKDSLSKEDEGLFNTEYDILKSLLYFLIHRNDMICINYILNDKDKNNKNFVFMTHQVSQKLSKIFICMLLKFNRSKNLKKTLIYDFYIKKIMELMVGSNDFYLKSLTNISTIPNSDYNEIVLISNSSIYSKVKSLYRNDIFFNFFFLKSSELGYVNREFKLYNINYFEWLWYFSKFIDSLYSFIKKEIIYEPSFLEKYQVLFEDQFLNGEVKKKISSCQQVLKFTDLFDKINECLDIYSKGIDLFKEAKDKENIRVKQRKDGQEASNNDNDNNIIDNFDKDDSGIISKAREPSIFILDALFENANNKLTEFILPNDQILKLMKFIYILIFKSNENLSLFLNFNYHNFTNVFMYHLEGDFFSFLDATADMFFFAEFNQYSFDNMNFFYKTFHMLLESLDFNPQEDFRANENNIRTLDIKKLNDIRDSKLTFSKDVFSNDKNNLGDVNPEAREREVIKCYLLNMNLMEKVVKVLAKGIQSASLSDTELISVVEHFLMKIIEFKSNSTLVTLLRKCVQNDLDSMNLPLEEYSKDEIKLIILDFTSIYFFFINELISNDFLFFNILNSEYHFIFTLEEVDTLLKRKDIKVPFKLEAELVRFLVSLKLDRGFNFCNIENQISNMYLCEVPEGISNQPTKNIMTSMNYLSLLTHSKNMSVILAEKANLLLSILNNFDVFFDNCFNFFNYSEEDRRIEKIEKCRTITSNQNQNYMHINNSNLNDNNNLVFSTENIIEKKTSLLRFYEFCIIRPVFSLFNSFLLEIKQLQGESLFLLFDMVFQFMKASYYLFKNIVRINEENQFDPKASVIEKEGINRNLTSNLMATGKSLKQKKLNINLTELFNNENKAIYNLFQQSQQQQQQQSSSFSGEPINLSNNNNQGTGSFNIKAILDQIYNFEELTVVSELNFKDLEDLRRDIILFTEDKIKYFELSRVQSVLLRYCELFLKNPEKNMMSTSMKGSNLKSLKKEHQKARRNPPKIMKRIEALTEKYEDKVGSTYDENLALISIFESSDSEVDIEMAKEIFKYLLMKFCDSLTYANYKKLILNQQLSKLGILQEIESSNNNLIKIQTNNLQNPPVDSNNNSGQEIMNIASLSNAFNNKNVHEAEPFHSRGNSLASFNFNHKRLNQINVKFSDKNSFKKYSPGNIDSFTVQDFKFQNAYIIRILNSLFLHASEIFQELLEEEISEYSLTNYILFVSQHLVFANLLTESRKNFDLKHIFPQCSLAFEIGTKSVKFLQNICEAHNITFQNKLFNLKLNKEAEIFNYPAFYKDELMKYMATTTHPDASKSIKEINNKEYNTKGSPTTKAKMRKTMIRRSSKELETSSEGFSNQFSRAVTEDKDDKLVHINKQGFGDNLPSEVKDKVSGKNLTDYLDKLAKIENEEKQKLKARKFTLINFYFNCLRVILSNSVYYQKSLLYKIRGMVEVEYISEFYQRFSDLIVEMIQGTAQANFDCIYRKLPESLNAVSESGVIKYENEDTFDCFMFCRLIIEVKGLLFNTPNIFCGLSRDVKYNVFFTINNIINQDIADNSIVKMFTGLLQPDKVLDLISEYLRGIYVKYVYKIDYEDDDFPEYFDFVEFVDNDFDNLLSKFKTESFIYEDPFFTLASQMFLYLKILGAKYEIPEAGKLMDYESKVTIKSSESSSIGRLHAQISAANTNKANLNNSQLNIGKEENSKDDVQNKDLNNSLIENKEQNNTILNTKMTHFETGKKPRLYKRLNKHHINNLIITVKFFNKITKSVEFMIDSSNDEGDELSLKKIYFIIDPRVYLISKGAISSFLDNVDRSSSTTKLKALISNLNYFISEIEYKYKHIQESKILKRMLEVDYNYADKLNFLFAITINAILLVFLKDGYKNSTVYYSVCSIALLQMIMNLIYMSFFIISKWRFYVILEKSKLDSKNLTIMNYLDIFLLNSFLFNDEVYIMILNILVGFIASWTHYTTFLFCLQLLTIVKFVPAVKEIVMAFQMRIGQLMSMIVFLFIILFAYANIGFRFYYTEFEISISDDQVTNICISLLECTIAYFNLGVRSGGGIGDLLQMKSYNDSYLYWVRYVTDMVFYITVILLLLNMVNGVIVSTFSQIREENNARDDDMNNKCFICSIERLEFEKRKISFKEHNKKEHNIRTYIKYLVWLKMINEKDLDGDQSFIMKCINQEEISCFPVLRSSTLGDLSDKLEEEEDAEGNKED